jgi:hypothetical protein
MGNAINSLAYYHGSHKTGQNWVYTPFSDIDGSVSQRIPIPQMDGFIEYGLIAIWTYYNLVKAVHYKPVDNLF